MAKEAPPFLDEVAETFANVENVLRGIRAASDAMSKAATDLRVFLEQQWAKPLTVRLETPETDKLEAQIQDLNLKVASLEEKLKPILGEPVKTVKKKGK
jgi:hypothetical protein